MSIQIVEIAQPSTVAVVEVRQGPAGPAGLNEITSATTSDGTADLSISNLTTATAEVTGTLTAPHIHGNLAGSVYAHVRAGENLAKGDPVYVSGSHGSGVDLIAIVSRADASNAAKMPAVGIMDAAVSANANGHMVTSGTITQINTAGYSINAELYVAPGGGMTATPPSARAQPVARVERSNINEGAILVKVNGLSASDATPSTLVRRTSDGGASFGPLATGSLSATAISSDTHSITSSAGTTITGPLTLSGSGSDTLAATYSNTISLTGTTGVTIAGGPLTFNSSGFAYAAGAAAAHRTALGLGTGDSPTFAGVTTTGSVRVGTNQYLGGPDADSGFFVNDGRTFDWFRDGVGYARFGAGCNFRDYIGIGATISSPTVFLYYGGNDILEQRRGTGLQPQTSRIYNTYTSATSFERLNFRWDNSSGTPIAKIGTEKGSAGGVARDLVLETDGTERVRVSAAGNVGIGTTSPAQKLDVVGSIRVSSGEAYKSAGDLYLDAANNASTYFRDGSTVNAVITNLGNVGIGTASPAQKLDVVGSIQATGSIQTGGYTFATLPTPATGMRAYITDGAAVPIYMANAAGGGSTVTPVFYNGSNWINA